MPKDEESWLRYEVGLVIREVHRRLENLARFNHCNPYWIATVGQQVSEMMQAQDAAVYGEGVRRGWIVEAF